MNITRRDLLKTIGVSTAVAVTGVSVATNKKPNLDKIRAAMLDAFEPMPFTQELKVSSTENMCQGHTVQVRGEAEFRIGSPLLPPNKLYTVQRVIDHETLIVTPQV